MREDKGREEKKGNKGEGRNGGMKGDEGGRDREGGGRGKAVMGVPRDKSKIRRVFIPSANHVF